MMTLGMAYKKKKFTIQDIFKDLISEILCV